MQVPAHVLMTTVASEELVLGLELSRLAVFFGNGRLCGRRSISLVSISSVNGPPRKLTANHTRYRVLTSRSFLSGCNRNRFWWANN